MSDFENEITPGVERLVALLNENGFLTNDSGDGVSNQELDMGCAMEGANVFLDLRGKTGQESIVIIDQVYRLLLSKGVVFPEHGGHDSPMVGMSYDPSNAEKGSMGFILNLDDEMIWGADPELPRKRLGYQIRYCENWIAHPPIEKMVAAGEGPADVVIGIEHYEHLRETFAARLAAMDAR